jgi:hypothetical protein
MYVRNLRTYYPYSGSHSVYLWMYEYAQQTNKHMYVCVLIRLVAVFCDIPINVLVSQ